MGWKSSDGFKKQMDRFMKVKLTTNTSSPGHESLVHKSRHDRKIYRRCMVTFFVNYPQSWMEYWTSWAFGQIQTWPL